MSLTLFSYLLVCFNLGRKWKNRISQIPEYHVQKDQRYHLSKSTRHTRNDQLVRYRSPAVSTQYFSDITLKPVAGEKLWEMFSTAGVLKVCPFHMHTEEIITVRNKLFFSMSKEQISVFPIPFVLSIIFLFGLVVLCSWKTQPLWALYFMKNHSDRRKDAAGNDWLWWSQVGCAVN